jgi:hypothetical protein
MLCQLCCLLWSLCRYLLSIFFGSRRFLRFCWSVETGRRWNARDESGRMWNGGMQIRVAVKLSGQESI